MRLQPLAAHELMDILVGIAQTTEGMHFDVIGGVAFATVERASENFELRLEVVTEQELLEEL